MPGKKIEARDDDTLIIRAKVTRVSPDGDQVTIDVWGQKITGHTQYVPFEKHDKGHNWPG